MLTTSVVICTFVRSSVISYNDLGWRGFMIAQFVLILWSVEFWPTWPELSRGRIISGTSGQSPFTARRRPGAAIGLTPDLRSGAHASDACRAMSTGNPVPYS